MEALPPEYSSSSVQDSHLFPFSPVRFPEQTLGQYVFKFSYIICRKGWTVKAKMICFKAAFAG